MVFIFNCFKRIFLFMNKKHVINKNRDFCKAYKRGAYRASSILVTYAVKNRLNSQRFGITTSKKTGNAVKRNRARRVIRAALAQIKDRILCGYDIVFVSRQKTSEVKTFDVLSSMQHQLSKLGLIK